MSESSKHQTSDQEKFEHCKPLDNTVTLHDLKATGEVIKPLEAHFRPKLGLWASIALGYIVVSTWIASSLTLSVVLSSGGTNCLVFGLLICVVCNVISASSLSEAASIAAGGNQEVWSYLLAPASWKRFAAFINAWITACGYITLGLAGETVLAQLVLAIANVNNPSYVIQASHVTALIIAFVVLTTLFGIFGARLLAAANQLNFVINVGGLIIISITLLVMSRGNYNSARQVFVTIDNQSGWNNNFIPYVASLGQAAAATTAFDSVSHFAGEMKDPRRSVPIAMIFGVGLNGIVGLAYVIVLAFIAPVDLTSLTTSSTGFPFAQLLLDATGSPAGTTVLLMLLLVPFSCTVADVNMASARILLQFAEKGGLPSLLARANTKLDCPTWATALVAVIQLGLSFIFMGSSSAFSSFISVPSLCLGLSYAIVSALMLIHGRSEMVSQPPAFYLGKIAGPFCNVVTIIFTCFITVFLCFPASYPVTAASMNYTSVIYTAVLLSGAGLWIFQGREKYRGPIVTLSEF